MSPPFTPRPWVRPCLLAGNAAAPVALFATHFQHAWMVGLAAVIHAGLVVGLFVPGCGWLGPVATRFRPRGREVWLTIDDGPAGEESLRLSEEMTRRGVRATFFVKGKNLARDAAVARALLDAGHTLANHTETHPSHLFWGLPRPFLRRELDACNAALQQVGAAATATTTRWFRAPAGIKNLGLHRALAERGMRLVAWSVRGRDGVVCEPAAVTRRVLAGISPGSIVLLHEGRRHSVEAILRVIDELQRLDYTFVIPADDQLV